MFQIGFMQAPLYLLHTAIMKDCRITCYSIQRVYVNEMVLGELVYFFCLHSSSLILTSQLILNSTPPRPIKHPKSVLSTYPDSSSSHSPIPSSTSEGKTRASPFPSPPLPFFFIPFSTRLIFTCNYPDKYSAYAVS